MSGGPGETEVNEVPERVGAAARMDGCAGLGTNEEVFGARRLGVEGEPTQGCGLGTAEGEVARLSS